MSRQNYEEANNQLLEELFEQKRHCERVELQRDMLMRILVDKIYEGWDPFTGNPQD